MTVRGNIKNIHGCALNVSGVGVLLLGEPATGKSELSLELIDRGHSFIADDMVKVYLDSSNELYLTSVVADFLHNRALGFINIRRLYPDKIATSVKLDLVIELQNNISSTKIIDYKHYALTTYTILDKKISKYSIDANNKSALLIELIVKQYCLLLTGYDSNHDFMAKQQQLCK